MLHFVRTRFHNGQQSPAADGESERGSRAEQLRVSRTYRRRVACPQAASFALRVNLPGVVQTAPPLRRGSFGL